MLLHTKGFIHNFILTYWYKKLTLNEKTSVLQRLNIKWEQLIEFRICSDYIINCHRSVNISCFQKVKVWRQFFFSIELNQQVLTKKNLVVPVSKCYTPFPAPACMTACLLAPSSWTGKALVPLEKSPRLQTRGFLNRQFFQACLPIIRTYLFFHSCIDPLACFQSLSHSVCVCVWVCVGVCVCVCVCVIVWVGAIETALWLQLSRSKVKKVFSSFFLTRLFCKFQFISI